MCHEKYQYIECHRFDIHIRVWPGTTAFVYTLRPISIGDIIRLRKRPAETRAPLIVHCFTRGTLPMHGYHGLWYLSDRLTDADLTGSLFQTKKMHCHCNPPDYLRIQNAPNFPHGPLYNQPTSTLASAHLHLNMRGFSRNGVETTKKKKQWIYTNWYALIGRSNRWALDATLYLLLIQSDSTEKSNLNIFLLLRAWKAGFAASLTIVSRRGASMIYWPFLVYKNAV